MSIMTDVSTSAARRRSFPRFVWVVAAIVALYFAAGVTTPSFATFDNMLVIVRAASITGIVAIGMSYVTISGNLFALSAAALGAFLAVIFALAVGQLGFAAGLAATLVVAIMAGMAQGLSISLVGNPIITTLAFSTVFRGLAALFSGNSIVRIDSDVALALGTGRPLGVPMQSWAFIALALVSWALIRRARLGRLLVLSGANPATAIASGLNVRLATIIAFVALSVGVAIMAVFTVSQFSQAKADLFAGYDFDYIAAVLVGGIALRGGQGSPLQAALGAILIALLQNFMLLNGFTAGLRMTIVGGLVLLATGAFHLLQRRLR